MSFFDDISKIFFFDNISKIGPIELKCCLIQIMMSMYEKIRNKKYDFGMINDQSISFLKHKEIKTLQYYVYGDHYLGSINTIYDIHMESNIINTNLFQIQQIFYNNIIYVLDFISQYNILSNNYINNIIKKVETLNNNSLFNQNYDKVLITDISNNNNILGRDYLNVEMLNNDNILARDYLKSFSLAVKELFNLMYVNNNGMNLLMTYGNDEEKRICNELIRKLNNRNIMSTIKRLSNEYLYDRVYNMRIKINEINDLFDIIIIINNSI